MNKVMKIPYVKPKKKSWAKLKGTFVKFAHQCTNCILCTVLLAICFSSCTRASDEESESIIGVWRLDKVTNYMMGITYDYVQYSILYEFDTDSILTVTGEIGQIEQMEWYGGHRPGVYTYSVIEREPGPYDSMIEKEYSKILIIRKYQKEYLSINYRKMVFQNKYCDGSIYYLSKIN